MEAFDILMRYIVNIKYLNGRISKNKNNFFVDSIKRLRTHVKITEQV